MKTRRHHNNKGYRQIKRGKTVDQVKRIARKLKIPYGGLSSRSSFSADRDSHGNDRGRST